MNFVQRKGTTAKSKLTIENLMQQKRQFVADLVAIIKMEEILGELIFKLGSN